MVYEEQGILSEALQMYLKALVTFCNTGLAEKSGLVLPSLSRIMPGLSSEEKARLREALPEECHELLTRN
jgi:hypothetical protein